MDVQAPPQSEDRGILVEGRQKVRGQDDLSRPGRQGVLTRAWIGMCAVHVASCMMCGCPGAHAPPQSGHCIMVEVRQKVRGHMVCGGRGGRGFSHGVG